jgi:uncharacterized spore protein YtfJ
MSQATNTAVLEQIRDAMEHSASGRVFGDPVTQDGVTVLPVAKVSGGGGGGGGTASEEPLQTGQGGGFGVTARPLGVFIIKDGQVGWRPALDLNKVIIGGQIVAVVALLTLRALLRRR